LTAKQDALTIVKGCRLLLKAWGEVLPARIGIKDVATHNRLSVHLTAPSKQQQNNHEGKSIFKYGSACNCRKCFQVTNY
jgi:hypothetical protein